LKASDGGHSTICPQDSSAKSEQIDISQQIDPKNVVIGSGCSSLLGHLFFCLAEPGDAVLIPLPYYAAFEKDMKVIFFYN